MLNYHHLRYFWAVAHEGSVTRAAARLHTTQPTVSDQLRKLETALGQRLFARVGRALVITGVGKLALRYADEIFSLGEELSRTVGSQTPARPETFVVGIVDAMPKLAAYRFLEPSTHLPAPVRLVCREGRLDRLLAELSIHALDMVLSDAPMGPGVRVKAFNHLLGESPVTVFGAQRLARRHRRNFPQSLHGAPFLLPSEDGALRRTIDDWCEVAGIRPAVTGEFQDSALMKVFGQAGMGLFCAPTFFELEVCRQYRVAIVGRLPELRERFYAITGERRIQHPAVTAISQVARTLGEQVNQRSVME